MEKMIIANIALGVFNIFLSLIPIVYLLDGRRYRQWLNRYFFGIVISNLCMVISDLAIQGFLYHAGPWWKAALCAFTVLYYIASAVLLYFFSCYIATYMRFTDRTKNMCLGIVKIMCAVVLFCAFISPIKGTVFYMTDDGCRRGPLFFISLLIPLSCYLLFTVLVIRQNKKLKSRELVFSLLCIFFPLGSTVAQMFLHGITVVNSGISLVIQFILVNIQIEQESTIKQQERELAEQRIDLMLSQIQLHFLYNTLGTIAYLC